jgi:tetratricopeptide (TPR) repeat protein
MQQPLNQQVAALHRRAQHAIAGQRLKEAHDCCARILSLEPGHADAHFLMGMIAFAQNRIGKSLALIDRAIARVPDNAEYLARRGQCLILMKRYAEARESAERALALGPEDGPTLDTIGVTLSRVGEHARAIDVLSRAVAAAPKHAQYHFNLASAHLFTGHFDAAEACYETAIAAKPDFYRAHWALSDLVKATPERNHIERLERLLEAGGHDADSALYLCHALAKEHEDVGDDVGALDYLIRGKTAKRATVRYDIARDRALFAAVEEVFDAAFVRRAAECGGWPSDEPIFVVGMPRTGTTLVERILTSHSSVFSAGELQDFGLALKRISASQTNAILDAETLRAAAGVDFAELGQRYLASTRPATGHTPRFVDKMPMNFFYIGCIALALPNAKIICLRRHPLDTCVANFRQLFRLNHSYYNYAHDLNDTADYYAMFDRLIAHWDAVLPGRVLQVRYEDVVAEQEAQTRRLLEYCGLPWEDACLAFHANAAPVATASAVQVREPIYSRSIGRWKRYGARLDPIRERLERAGIDTR